MDSVHIISPRKITLQDLRPILSQHWAVEDTAYGDLVVRGSSSRVYISNDPNPEPPETCSLILEHSGGLELLKQVLEVIGNDPGITIDNEFGTVLPGDAFVARLRFEPDWDWRT
jgi:hypothetical protein